MVKVTKALANSAALEAFRTLLVDLARPRPANGALSAPHLSASEVHCFWWWGLVVALVELSVSGGGDGGGGGCGCGGGGGGGVGD